MKKASTTNKSIIILGVILIAAVAIVIAFAGRDKDEDKEFSQEQNIIEGAMANIYEAPGDLASVREYDTLIGDKKADLQVVVYEDFTSQYSASLAQDLDRLLDEFDNKLAVVVRPYILSSSNISQLATMAYLCASEQDKGEEMRSALLENVSTGTNFMADYQELAQELGINNSDNFSSCLIDSEKLAKMEQIKQEAKSNLVLGAPTIIIGDEMLVGARPYDDFVDSNGDAIEGLRTVISRKLQL